MQAAATQSFSCRSSSVRVTFVVNACVCGDRSAPRQVHGMILCKIQHWIVGEHQPGEQYNENYDDRQHGCLRVALQAANSCPNRRIRAHITHNTHTHYTRAQYLFIAPERGECVSFVQFFVVVFGLPLRGSHADLNCCSPLANRQQ